MGAGGGAWSNFCTPPCESERFHSTLISISFHLVLSWILLKPSSTPSLIYFECLCVSSASFQCWLWVSFHFISFPCYPFFPDSPPSLSHPHLLHFIDWMSLYVSFLPVLTLSILFAFHFILFFFCNSSPSFWEHTLLWDCESVLPGVAAKKLLCSPK